MSIGTAIVGVAGKILSGSVQVAADYFTKRAEIRSKELLRKIELEDAIHQRRVDLIKEGLHADANWELEQIRNSGGKDEWVLGLLSVPLVLVFIPQTQGVVLSGFAALETCPEWYRWLVMIIFTAIFGIRIWRRQQSDT